MTDLNMIKEFRRDTPEITETAAEAARDRLTAAWSGSPAAPRPVRRRRIRPALRIGLAGALGVTVATGVTLIRMGDEPAAPTTLTPKRVAGAYALGDRAARAVENQPYTRPGPHQWIYERFRYARLKGDMNTGHLGLDPHRTKDIELWRRVDHQANAEYVGGKFKVSAPGRRYDQDGNRVGYKDASPDMSKVVSALPTDPAAMLKALYDPKTLDKWAGKPGWMLTENSQPDGLRRIFHGPPRVLVLNVSKSELAFSTATELVDEPLPPKVRAALFRALAMVPGVTEETDVVDAAGRHGVGFAFDGKKTYGSNWERDVIILDPVTYKFLGNYWYAARDHPLPGTGATVKAGAVMLLDATLEQRIVDKPGQRP